MVRTGWLLDPEARPTFEELEGRMNEFLSDPLRYILTVVSIHELYFNTSHIYIMLCFRSMTD